MIDNWGDAIVDLAYFVAAILLIVSINRLASPATARLGVRLAAAGMVVAVLATFALNEITRNYALIIAALVIGGVIGFLPAQRVQMTAMPQMVAVFNGLGGAASALIGLAEYFNVISIGRGSVLAIVLAVLVGSIVTTGSAVAVGKLQGFIEARPILIDNRQMINGGVLAGAVVLGIIIVALQDGNLANALLVVLFLAALAVGVLFVIPIGGADMPVVIALLNASTGISVAATGIVLDNQLLIIAGALVGASGTYLSLLMARAMNRSIGNVLFGAFGATTAGSGTGAAGAEERSVREVVPEDAAVSLAYADRVIIVPGYGLAVAQAQHNVQELAEELKSRGVDVRYAIHPVAGRMPGHMNVLLAEANVPYEDLYEMDRINGDFARTDVALVIGANDVTNPAARDDPNSPIYGMPVLRVDEAASTIVLKRSMGSGFAGVENELFYNEKTAMLFGDAKSSLGKLIGDVKAA